MRTRTIELDIDSQSFKVLKYKQFDHNNLLKVIIKREAEIIDLTSYAIRVFFQTQNGKVLQKNATLINGEINIVLESILLQHHGKILFEIVLSNGKEITTTFTMYLDVEKSIDKNAPIIGNPEWDIIKDGLSVLDDKVNREELDNYYSKIEVDEKFKNVSVGENINLDGYAKKEELPTKISDLINDKGYLEEIPSQYITEDELEEKIKDVDLDNYYNKNEIDSIVENLDIEDCSYTGENLPENDEVIWFSNGVSSASDGITYDNPLIQELFACINALQTQVQKLQEEVDYLKLHGGGGSSSGGDIGNKNCLILEDGFILLLEDGGYFELETNVNSSFDAFLLEDGSNLLLEDGSNLLLETSNSTPTNTSKNNLLLENGENILLESA